MVNVASSDDSLSAFIFTQFQIYKLCIQQHHFSTFFFFEALIRAGRKNFNTCTGAFHNTVRPRQGLCFQIVVYVICKQRVSGLVVVAAQLMAFQLTR